MITKRVLLVLLVSGCSIPQLEAGRYACHRGQENQCPGAWRCGLENVCHRLGDTQTAWQCADDTDCEGQYVCGLTNDRQARECHDPVAGKAWQCDVTTDCSGGWQCGLSKSRDFRECHDPAAPREWPCDLDDDCVGGWRCGLSFTPGARECHDPSAPQAWLCGSDADCLGGYRCAADGRCVSPLADALEEGPTPGIELGAHINPLSSTSPMGHVSIAPTYGAGLGRGKRSALFTQDERLRALVIDPLRNTVVQRDFGPATDVVTLAAQGARGTDTNGVSDDVNRGYVALTDGGASFVVLDGTGSPVFFDLEQPTDHFKWGSTTDTWVPSLIAFSQLPPEGSSFPWALARIRGDDFVRFDYLVTAYMSGYLDFEDVAGNRLIDVAALQRNNQTECTFAVDRRGLWVGQRGQPPFVASGAFVPLPLPGFRSACGPGEQFRALSTLSDRWLAAATEPSDGGQPRVSLFDVQRMWIDRSTVAGENYFCSVPFDSCDPTEAIPIDVQFGPCTACPAGSTLLEMAVIAVPGAAAPAIEVRCRESDGSSRLLRLTGQSQSSTQCLRELLVGTGSLFTEPLQSIELLPPGAIAFHGSAGQLWAGASALEAHSITFDRAAFGVVRLSSSPWDVIAFADGLIGTPTVLGLLSNPSRLAAAVRNAPSWAISGSEVLALGEGASVADARPVAAAATVFQTPTSATIVPTRDGRQLIVTGANRIYAADLNATLDGGLLAVVTERGAVVSSIESLAFPAQAASTTAWASGYAVSGGAVIRLVADSPTRWHSEPVDLPPTPSPSSVWYQGSRGRVGFQDGSVFSLPSRVAIAGPVTGGAVGFEQVCGQQLALAPAGLFRLEVNGTNPVGVWRPIALPEPFATADWDSGSIHAAGSELFLFKRTGEALGIRFEGCPQQ